MQDPEAKQASRQIAQLFSIVLLAVALGYIGYFRLFEPVSAVHVFPGEPQMNLDIPLGFDPKPINKPHIGDGGLLGLKVELNKPEISPVPGSSIKGTVRLIANGLPSSRLPQSLWHSSDSADKKTPRVYIKTYGILGTDCALNCEPTQYFLPLTNHPAPSLGSSIYSPSARSYVNPLKSDAPIDEYLDFQNGRAEFEITYQGGRNYPSLVIDVYTDPTGKLHQRLVVPFSDQLGHPLEQPSWKEELGTGATQYQITSSPEQLSVGKPQLVKLTVTTPSDTATNYRRVNVWINPWGQIARNTALQKRIDSVPVRWQAVKAGKFLNNNNLDSIEGLSNAQVQAISEAKIDYSQILTPDAQASEVDLVGGKAETYFWYDGQAYLTNGLQFVVQPIDFDYEYRPYPYSIGTLNDDLETRYAADLPSGKSDSAPLLYGKWVPENDLLWHSYAKKKIVFNNFPGADTNTQSGLWLLIWLWIAMHIGQMLFAGGWLAILAIRGRSHPKESQPLRLGRSWRQQLKRGALSFGCLVMAFLIVQTTVLNLFAEIGAMKPANADRENISPIEFTSRGKQTKWAVDIKLDQSYVSSFPGQINKGTVRIQDESGNTVPVNGAVSLGVIGNQEESRLLADNHACSINTDDPTKSDPTQGSIGRLHNTYGFDSRADLDVRSKITDDIQELLDEAGADYSSNGPGNVEWTDEDGSQVELDHDLITYTNEVVGTKSSIISPQYNYSGNGSCNQTLVVIQNGVGNFAYETEFTGQRWVTFAAMGYEIGENRGHIREIDKWPSYSLSSARLGNFIVLPGTPPSFSIGSLRIGASLDEITTSLAANGALFSARSFEVEDFPGELTNMPQISGLEYYYRVVAAPKIYFGPKKRFEIKLVPNRWGRQALPEESSNRISLTIVAIDEHRPRGSLFGRDESKIYPAYFVSPGSEELVYTLEADAGVETITATVELADDIPANYVLGININGLGFDKLPYYYTSHKQIEVLMIPPFATEVQQKPVSEPPVLSHSLYIPIQSQSWDRLMVLAWLPAAWLVGLLALLYTAIRRRKV